MSERKPPRKEVSLKSVAGEIQMCMRKDPVAGTPCIRRAEVCYEFAMLSQDEPHILMYLWLCSEHDIDTGDITVTFTRASIESLLRKAAAQTSGLITP